MINGTGASMYDFKFSGNIGIKTWVQTKGYINPVRHSATWVKSDLYFEIRRIFLSNSTHSNK